MFDALRELANKVTPAQPSTPKRSIGFVLHEDGNANKGSTEVAAKVVKAQHSKKA